MPGAVNEPQTHDGNPENQECPRNGAVGKNQADQQQNGCHSKKVFHDLSVLL